MRLWIEISDKRADRLFNQLHLLLFSLNLVLVNTFLVNKIKGNKVFNNAINILNSVCLDCVLRCFFSEASMHMMSKYSGCS